MTYLNLPPMKLLFLKELSQRLCRVNPLSLEMVINHLSWSSIHQGDVIKYNLALLEKENYVTIKNINNIMLVYATYKTLWLGYLYIEKLKFYPNQ